MRALPAKVFFTSSQGIAGAAGATGVAGAAAAIWRVCRQCNHKQVAKCLLNTAKTIGGKAETGNGLVQTQDAYTCLVEDVGCCKA